MLARMVPRLLIAVAVVIFPAASSAYRYLHVVLPGETLRGLAKRYRTSPVRIRRQNQLKGSRLRPGQRLRIVSRHRVRAAALRASASRLRAPRSHERARYRVRSGDSLSVIAARHKMKLVTMIALNRRASRRALRVGERLWILRPSRGRGGVDDLLQLTSGPGYMVRDPKRSWGTFLTVTRLMDVMGDYQQEYPEDPQVRIHDVSHKRGGYLYPHRSHRLGRDVDIVYPVRRRYAGVKWNKIKVHMVELERTWFMVKRLLDTKDVVYIFVDRRLQRRLYRHALRRGEDRAWLRQVFQYPAPSQRAIIRHEPGHDDHLHVRFRPAKRIPPPNA